MCVMRIVVNGIDACLVRNYYTIHPDTMYRTTSYFRCHQVRNKQTW